MACSQFLPSNSSQALPSRCFTVSPKTGAGVCPEPALCYLLAFKSPPGDTLLALLWVQGWDGSGLMDEGPRTRLHALGLPDVTGTPSQACLPASFRHYLSPPAKVPSDLFHHG